MTIFIVEDDKPLRDTFADVLRQVGYRVIVAGNGHEALERMRSQRPSFIFVDLVMPKMNGIELIRALRADSELSTIPIAAMTASNATGADGILLMKKPFRAEAAVALIEKFAQSLGRRAQDDVESDAARSERAPRRDRALLQRKGKPRIHHTRRPPSEN